MGLFDQVVGAISNPTQQASSDGVGSILNAVGQMAGAGGSGGATTQVMSIVGQYVRSNLQQRREAEGEGAVAALVQQFSGTGANPEAVNALLSGEQQTEVTEAASNASGLDVSAIRSMLPMAVPLILNLLQSGGGAAGSQGGNSVLSTFLDSDGDSDVDIGDALSMASRFLGK